MGLDISLVRITDREVNEHCWLEAKELPQLLPLFSHQIRMKHFQYPEEEYDLEVFFYEELSYQRKGVQANFFRNFENDKCLTAKTEVERMRHYVIENLEEKFHKQFVERFIEGETIIIISW